LQHFCGNYGYEEIMEADFSICQCWKGIFSIVNLVELWYNKTNNSIFNTRKLIWNQGLN
jgi:hypothetical protein